MEGRAMPWVVGIDEAGYGPNLGPFVQAAVALQLPDNDLRGWKTLKSFVRRIDEVDDGRLVVDDSKKVYAGGAGLELLASGVFAALGSRPRGTAELLKTVLAEWCRGHLEDECWYDPANELEQVDCPAFTDRPRLHAAVVPSPIFNQAIDRT